ncbi:hypothetical protein FC72_GL000499 [Companilactobacillus tucceti DSM 20183]|uniref:Uncharacterized protein n=1 Tax=Companilactobacillus tucceti DSM 20183 TaxID=1423811 RepID=A0A0R1IZT4_9LACO|nr:hypothetical protein [Companilactobacillus tucceti]KRK64331.1 hypothetical protein FC72_GL000499 [Companilactobacillus tucceti DSM 20183]
MTAKALQSTIGINSNLTKALTGFNAPTVKISPLSSEVTDAITNQTKAIANVTNNLKVGTSLSKELSGKNPLNTSGCLFF